MVKNNFYLFLQHEDEENWPLEEKSSCKQSEKKLGISLNNQQPYIKDDSGCYYNYA